MSASYQIHPSIGIARIGNSDQHFVGPEYSFTGFPPKSFRDSEGRILRQAARFRVFRVEHGADGRSRAFEVDQRDARIVWTVTLANRKGVGRRLERDGNAGKWRNDVNPADEEMARPFIIGPVEGRVSLDRDPAKGKKSPYRRLERKHRLEGGEFQGQKVKLGDLAFDADGSLLVLGGQGVSRSVPEGNKVTGFADNDGWYDDTSDGKVQAWLEFKDGSEPVEAAPAAILVGPPDMAPEIPNLITLYDLARQIAINKGLRKAPVRPDFERDIKPILSRVLGYQWVNKYAAQRHGGGRPFDFDLEFWNRIGDPATDPGPRQRLFGRLRDPNSAAKTSGPTEMPRLHDDLGSFGEYDATRVLPLLPFQYEMLKKWCEGDFYGRSNPTPAPFESLTDTIDRVSMESCVGGPFYPGIETWEIIRCEQFWAGTDTDPFRLNFNNQELVPGKLTEGNALPWQSDFLDCAWEDNAGWWPAQRPDHVRVHPDSTEMQDWTDGLNQHRKRPAGRSVSIPVKEDMIDYWHLLGFVVKTRDSDGNVVFAEAERDPNGELPKRPNVVRP